MHEGLNIFKVRWVLNEVEKHQDLGQAWLANETAIHFSPRLSSSTRMSRR